MHLTESILIILYYHNPTQIHPVYEKAIGINTYTYKQRKGISINEINIVFQVNQILDIKIFD